MEATKTTTRRPFKITHENLMAATRGASTNQLVEGARMLTRPEITTDERTVRAAMIEVLIEREGQKAGDDLMDSLGL